MDKTKLGVIGGSGLYDFEALKHVRKVNVETPFGAPSGPYLLGELGQVELVFLARHGEGHTLLPSEVNYRANIHGFKQLGVKQVLSVSAVGSLVENIQPGDMVLPSQFFDRTRGRKSTFFGRGAAVHVSFGDPVCPDLSGLLADVLREQGIAFHSDCTYVCMEGPVFSTRAESQFYRQIKADVIGMTAIPEAKLAREAELCYATLALSTDYDCWRRGEEEVNTEAVLKVIAGNIAKAKNVILELSKKLSGDEPGCSCQQALEGAMLTSPDHVPLEAQKRLQALLGRFF